MTTCQICETRTFAEAMATLASAGASLLPSKRWAKICCGAQETAESQIAQRLLSELHAALKAALADGSSFFVFQKAFKPVFFAADGMSLFRGRLPCDDEDFFWEDYVRPSLEVLFQASWALANAKESWKQQQDVADVRPYLRYTGQLDGQVTPAHDSWHGIILPQNHPWWKEHYPPNGWRCNCKVMSLSDEDLASEGWHISEPPAGSYGVEPGWGTSPGARAQSVHATAHQLVFFLLSHWPNIDDEDDEEN